MPRLKIGLVGAGVIGKKHAMALTYSKNCELAGVVDVSSKVQEIASQFSVPYFRQLEDLLEDNSIDGLILSTPSDLHTTQGILCLENKIPVLVEKPLATTIDDAQALVNKADKTGIPILTGHYRRFNSQVETARDMIQSGQIGKLIGISAIWAMKKHDEYYDVAWRTKKGGGPILTNLIHDIDCLRWICGDIASVSSQVSNKIRGFEVEDSAAITILFESGALGTVLLTDAGPSPWAFEATTSENSDFAHMDDNCYRFVGTEGSLDFPQMRLWSYPDNKRAAWQFPMTKSQRLIGAGNPLLQQIEHFSQVIMGTASPRTDARDGAKTLSATLAVSCAAITGTTVTPADI
ncbi:MAG: oxidoreductase [Rhodospirillaceae bacterium]|mgnify:CR=1 FL=1|nr:oxidoreductase [Rhodospirillaceae bacterium]|tara:strand:- start:64 stop:1110 length:1047 start_codon:yes stop_codon:yes gene_type:complete